ncbi:hypothetical protein [Ralstonia sp. Ralssp110]|uniref:hypothetical protein n=1 Tax=Ralstonia sp. Ralssp110 TaxID=3243004 RepID=UPI0039B6A21F
MHRIFRNKAAGLLSFFFISSCSFATSKGSIGLAIKQTGDSPVVCLAAADENGNQPVRIHFVGVSHATGSFGSESYWQVEVPESSKPLYLKRGECLTYGQAIAGANILTEPKKLQPGVLYGIGLVPYDADAGFVYGANFCLMRQPNGKLKVVDPAIERGVCPAR